MGGDTHLTFGKLKNYISPSNKPDYTCQSCTMLSGHQQIQSILKLGQYDSSLRSKTSKLNPAQMTLY